MTERMEVTESVIVCTHGGVDASQTQTQAASSQAPGGQADQDWESARFAK